MRTCSVAEHDAADGIAERHQLKVIEDCAQARARWNGEAVGSFGMGCFSFFPTKTGAAGDAGAVTTSDADLARAMGELAVHGMPERYRTNLDTTAGLMRFRPVLNVKLPKQNLDPQANRHC